MSAVTMNTSEGPVTLELFDEDAPKTVSNFKDLADKGFYDGRRGTTAPTSEPVRRLLLTAFLDRGYEDAA